MQTFKKITLWILLVVCFSFVASGVMVEDSDWKIECVPEVSYVRPGGFENTCTFTNKLGVEVVRDVGFIFKNKTGFTRLYQGEGLSKESKKFKEKFVEKLDRSWYYYDDRSVFSPYERKVFNMRIDPYQGKGVTSEVQKWDGFIGNITSKVIDLVLDPLLNSEFYYSNFSLDNNSNTAQHLRWNNLTSNVNYTSGSNVVLHWSFDEGTGTEVLDSTLNGNDGTLNGDGWVAGRFGDAVNFSDSTSDSINLSDPNDYLNLSKRFAIGFWFNITDWGNTTGYTIVNKSGSFEITLQEGSGICAGRGSIRVRVFTELGVSETSFVKNSSINITDGLWHHLLVNYNLGTRPAWIDGGNVTACSATGPHGGSYINGSNESMIVGSVFNGSIDDLVMYNRTFLYENNKGELERLNNSNLPYHLAFKMPSGTFYSGNVDVNWSMFSIANITTENSYVLNVSCRGTVHNNISFGNSYTCGNDTSLNYTIDFTSNDTWFNELNITGDPFGLTNCSTDSKSTVVTMNFTLYDELTLQPLGYDGRISPRFSVWVNEEAQKVDSFSFDPTRSNNLCIYPNMTLQSRGSVEYTAENSSIRHLDIVPAVSIDNESIRYYRLYLLDDSYPTVTFSVIDEVNKPVSDATIKISKLDLATGNFILVQSLTTGLGGTVSTNMQLDREHRFEIYTSDDVLRKNETFTVTETSYVFKLVLEEVVGLEGYIDLANINFNLTCNNDSRVASLSWSYPVGLVDLICLKVINTSAGLMNLDYFECDGNVSGSLTSGSFSGNDTWLGVANAFEGDNVWVLETCDLDVGAEFTVLGLEGVFWAMLALVVVVTLGIVSQSIVISMVLVIPWLIFVTFFGLLAVHYSIGIGLVAVIILVIYFMKR